MNETPLSLLDRLRREPRDQPSWRRLTMLYGPLIRRWLQQHDTPEADADDLAQEVLLVLARDLGDFDHNGRTGAFRLWVRSITANRLRDYWRARRSRPIDSPVAVLGGPSFVVTNTGDTGLGTLREAIYNANFTPGAHTITFDIPATDPRHFYYRNDGVAGQVSQADIAVTTATSDADIADIDPDWAHSWFSILPSHDLPEIVNTVTIDGYSQPGSVANTLPALGPLNTVLKIELDGSNAPGEGLNLSIGAASVDASYSRIDGLAINRFSGDGIELNTLDGNNVIAGSFIGTDVSGTNDLGNGGSGIYLSLEDGDTIGGTAPADFNLISGNESNGIEALDPGGVVITGDLIGLDRNLAFAVGNSGAGILFTDQPRVVGASELADGVIRPNAEIEGPPTNDVHLDEMPGFAAGQQLGMGLVSGGAPQYGFTRTQIRSFQVVVRGNKGFESDSTVQAQTQGDPVFLAIDLGDDGVTPNHLGNADTGPNGLQNYPVLASATTTTATTITGTLNSLSSTSFRIEFYSETVGPDFRAGEEVLGDMDVTTDASGNASFTFPSPVRVPVGEFITAIATHLEAGTLTPIETSEFSAGIAVTAATAQPAANLSVFQSATPNPAPTGVDQTFGLTVANAGPDPASGVQLGVTLPAGATFVSATGGVAPVGGTLTFDLGTLANQASVTVSVTVGLDAPGTLVGTATVTSSTTDPATADYTTTVTVPGDSVGPTISNLLLPNPKAKTTPLVLTFSENLDPARAVNLSNYRLVTAGRDKKFGTKDDKVVALRSATYNVATHTVTLLPRKKLAAGVLYQITVDGTSAHGIVDRAGNLLDGDGDGRGSGNYVKIVKLTRSKARRGS